MIGKIWDYEIGIRRILGALVMIFGCAWVYFSISIYSNNIGIFEEKESIRMVDEEISDSKDKISKLKDMMKFGIKTMKSTDVDGKGYKYFSNMKYDSHNETWEIPLELILKYEEKSLKKAEKEKQNRIIKSESNIKKLKNSNNLNMRRKKLSLALLGVVLLIDIIFEFMIFV